MSINIPRLSRETADQLLQRFAISKCDRWAVLKASGPTLRDYLQGQITQDIHKLTAKCGIHTCLLTPQGKAVSELYIFEGHQNELIMLTPSSHALTTVNRLRQFALGHQLRIGVVETLAISSLQGANASEALKMFNLPEPGDSWLSSSRKDSEDIFALVKPAQPRGYWIVCAKTNRNRMIEQLGATDESEMEAMRIILGLPDFGTEWDESLHPLNANLIESDGVSFNKGCYVGQEVTARMNWRGGIKKKLYRVAIKGAVESLPCPIQSTAKIGELRSAAFDHEESCFGIALLPIEVVESSASLSLENGTTIEILEACHG